MNSCTMSLSHGGPALLGSIVIPGTGRKRSRHATHRSRPEHRLPGLASPDAAESRCGSCPCRRARLPAARGEQVAQAVAVGAEDTSRPSTTLRGMRNCGWAGLLRALERAAARLCGTRRGLSASSWRPTGRVPGRPSSPRRFRPCRGGRSRSLEKSRPWSSCHLPGSAPPGKVAVPVIREPVCGGGKA